MDKTYTNAQIDSAMRSMVTNQQPWRRLNEVQQYCVLNVPKVHVRIGTYMGTPGQSFRPYHGILICSHNHGACVFRINPTAPGPYMKQPKSDLNEYDISTEEYREIIFVDSGAVYRIDRPKKLFIRPGGSTHRVVDSMGVAHCYPAPEDMGLTVIRWKTKDTTKPVDF